MPIMLVESQPSERQAQTRLASVGVRLVSLRLSMLLLYPVARWSQDQVVTETQHLCYYLRDLRTKREHNMRRSTVVVGGRT